MPSSSDPITASANVMLAPMACQGTVEVRSALPDHHPHFALVGQVTVRWAQLENVLEVLIWEAMNVDQGTGAEATRNLQQTKQRFARLRRELKGQATAAQLLKLEQIERRAVELGERRNRITHDAWYVGVGGGVSQLRTGGRSGFEFGFNEVPEADIRTLVTNVDALISDLWEFRSDLGREAG